MVNCLGWTSSAFEGDMDIETTSHCIHDNLPYRMFTPTGIFGTATSTSESHSTKCIRNTWRIIKTNIFIPLGVLGRHTKTKTSSSSHEAFFVTKGQFQWDPQLVRCPSQINVISKKKLEMNRSYNHIKHFVDTNDQDISITIPDSIIIGRLCPKVLHQSRFDFQEHLEDRENDNQARH